MREPARRQPQSEPMRLRITTDPDRRLLPMAGRAAGRSVAGSDTATKEAPMPTGTILEPLQHTFLAPPFEQATVVDAMRVGVVSCPRDVALREVARTMATYRIHSVVVSDADGGAWGIVSDLDLARAAGQDLDGVTAGDAATTELVTVGADESLARAAQLMAEHEIAHLVVVQPADGHPVGVLSTLDLAGVLAWGGMG
jgi:CBS domain-containing protein